MSDNLCQDGLGLVPEGIVGSCVSMSGEFKGFCQLPAVLPSEGAMSVLVYGYSPLQVDG